MVNIAITPDKIALTSSTFLVLLTTLSMKDSYKSLKELDPRSSNKKKNLVFLSFLSSLLITVSGLIFLYIAYKDEDLNVEIAFN